jgi:NAD(P)-dependent dehydrogenase (short-subunit alcohol dehydrogenase family)
MTRSVLITGASAGIGKATADLLAAHGWSVTGGSRRGTAGTGWSGTVMDVDDDDSVASAVAAAVEANAGRLDALVACAGWGLAGAVEMTPVEDGKDQFETNFWGVHRTVVAALPVMRRQGGGRIVVVGSIGGVIAIPFQAFYSASKFALEGYTEALAWEVAQFGIEVTIVQPGNVRTDFTSSRRDVAVPEGKDDPYRAAVEKAVSRMEQDEQTGAPAALVARTIEKVLNASRPPRRVSAGKAFERAGIIAKRVLPYPVFEKAAKSSLGL